MNAPGENSHTERVERVATNGDGEYEDSIIEPEDPYASVQANGDGEVIQENDPSDDDDPRPRASTNGHGEEIDEAPPGLRDDDDGEDG